MRSLKAQYLRFLDNLAGVPNQAAKWLTPAALILLPLFAQANRFEQLSKPSNNRTYSRYVLIGDNVIPIGDDKVFFTASLTSGEFFAGLRRKQLANGQLEFSKAGIRILDYPAELSVELLCWVSKAGLQPAKDPLQDASNSRCGSLDFQVQWKGAVKTRPVKKFEVQRHGTEDVSHTMHWRYSIHVSDEAVPLTDHLVISVLTSTGSFLTRFSSRL